MLILDFFDIRILVTGDHSHLDGGEAPRMDVTPAAGEENIDVDLPQGMFQLYASP